MSEIEALAKLCQGWGGKLVLLSSEDFDKKFGDPTKAMMGEPWSEATQKAFDTWAKNKTFYPAPFADNLGVVWKRKTVYGPLGPNNWPAIIHEMGHVFACKKAPDRSEDFSFFGWELAVVKLINGNMYNWEYSNRDYQVGGDDGVQTRYDLLGQCSRREKKRIYAERIEVARKAGLLNRKLEPIAIR